MATPAIVIPLAATPLAREALFSRITINLRAAVHFIAFGNVLHSPSRGWKPYIEHYEIAHVVAYVLQRFKNFVRKEGSALMNTLELIR